jgi:2-polyprenyl-3-methyl-5-hydroxy-6-metoxy-1,4-benzoquinol methylase
MKASLKESALEGFDHPTAVSGDRNKTAAWQEANRRWWETNPMRYDWRDKIAAPEFSKEFYEEIDRRFFSDAASYMPWRKRPFDALIDFDLLRSKDILEIGTGNGSHAELLARSAKSYTGIDLTQYAVKSNSHRLHHQNLEAKLCQMDAEDLSFADESFDIVWSWGVIHHSANTERILQQIKRVLRPGGEAIIMVYHRNWWNALVLAGFFHGILRGEFFRGRSTHDIMQRWTDGALARFYTVGEWESLTRRYFVTERTQIFGSKAELFPLPSSPLKRFLMDVTPNMVTRRFLNSCRMGSYLVSSLRKEKDY